MYSSALTGTFQLTALHVLEKMLELLVLCYYGYFFSKIPLFVLLYVIALYFIHTFFHSSLSLITILI